jgi:uncharacterized membrane protein
MSPPEVKSDEKRLEERLGTLLIVGVIAAATVVLLGGSLYLVQHGRQQPAYHTFRSEPSDLRTIPGILRAAAKLRSEGVIQTGLLLLIATPIARVAFAAYGFARQRDWLYVGVASIVLSILIFSLLFHR